MKLTLILGGVRSGKSRFAQELAAGLGPKVLFVATGQPLDEEMNSRIEAHKKSRPPTWRALEAPTDIAGAISHELGDAEAVIIDCLTLLVSNIMGGKEYLEVEQLWRKVAAELEALTSFMKTSPAHFIIISNEVGLGVVPPYPSGRVYRDILGLANQMLAQHAEEVYLMIAGIPIPLFKKK